MQENVIFSSLLSDRVNTLESCFLFLTIYSALLYTVAYLKACQFLASTLDCDKKPMSTDLSRGIKRQLLVLNTELSFDKWKQLWQASYGTTSYVCSAREAWMVPMKYSKKPPNKTQEKSSEISSQEFTLGDQKLITATCVATYNSRNMHTKCPLCLLSLGQNFWHRYISQLTARSRL